MGKEIYLIQEDMNLPKARILEYEDEEVYLQTLKKASKTFRQNSRAYSAISSGIDSRISDVPLGENISITSQYFFNTFLNSCLPEGQKVASFKDIERIYCLDKSFFENIYVCAPEIILRTETPTEEDSKYILKDLVSQVNGKHDFSSENPLLISGLELVRDRSQRNYYGFLLKVGKDTKFVNDKRFVHSNNEEQIDFGGQKVSVRTKEHGLSDIVVSSDRINSGTIGLTASSGYGRVVLIKE